MLKTTLAGFIAILAVGGMVQAQTIYNDGETHTVNGPSGPIEVLNGTTVILDAQATVTGGFVPGPPGYIATVFGDASSTINLNGAQVTAPQAPGSPSGNISGIGILSEGPFTATGGFSEGGPGDTSQGGGWALLAYNSVQISGGTFQGGNGAFGGHAAILTTSNSITAMISGGTFQGGDSSGSSSPGTGLILQLVGGNSTASITGGTFLGGSSVIGPGSSLLYQGEYAGPGSSDVNISGGAFREPSFLPSIRPRTR